MRDIVLVCGFGRCGSSMVMQMLAAGGMATVGRGPAYEDDRAGERPIDAAWMVSLAGSAVKVLDPHVTRPPIGPSYRVIWMERNEREQAKSQAKFLRMMAGVELGRHEVRAFAASYRRNMPEVDALFRAISAKVLRLRFEQVLANPERAALQIVGHLGTALDIRAMTAAVINRMPQCRPDLSIELSLVEKEKVHA